MAAGDGAGSPYKDTTIKQKMLGIKIHGTIPQWQIIHEILPNMILQSEYMKHVKYVCEMMSYNDFCACYHRHIKPSRTINTLRVILTTELVI